MNLSLFRTLATAVISEQPAVTREVIRDAISQVAGMAMFADTTIDTASVEDELAAQYQISMNGGAVLVDEDHKPWLPQRNSEGDIDWYYWRRYRNYLAQLGFSPNVINTMHEVTDRILGLIENPHRSDPWDRRGLVIGHVQSGKTSNYIGLVNKAADAGYKLIVIIAGVHNKLRNQTQVRVDEGFIGRDSALVLRKKENRFVGVGKLGEERFPVPFTNSIADFNKSTASSAGVSLSNLNEPAVFVIKKNPTTLTNLIEWLRAYSSLGVDQQIDQPFLLIDDEADNASINTSRDPQRATRINGQIRELLNTFTRSAYVGYTATPFANIFIDPTTDSEMIGGDLFPRDFIVSLDAPSNYVGPDAIFDGSESSPVVRHIDDNELSLPARQGRDFDIEELPESLHDAVRAFVLARAIRLLRGQVNSHNSMLVNASPYTRIHGQIRNRLQDILVDLQNQTSLYGGLAPDQAVKYPAISHLHRVWLEEFSGLEFSWPQVLGKLRESTAPISVVEINSRSKDALPYQDYKDSGLNVIAVGGYSLSRGLTLEGLIVSYFVRSSQMYDTLMQMGRWFGYRPGYRDLCRIWMPEEAVGWYEHIADAIEQLRDEIKTMESYGARPRDFGLKVRSHPGSLMVTARNKIGTGKVIPVSLSLGRQFAETAELRWDQESRQHNLKMIQNLVTSLRNDGFRIPDSDASGNRVLTRVPVQYVLQLMNSWRGLPTYYRADPELVSRYISGRGDALGFWDIAFMGLASADKGIVDASLGFPIIRQNRSAGKGSPRKGILRVTDKQRIASPTDERIGIDPRLVEKAIGQHRDETGKTSGTIPGHVYRSVRTRPLLLVHLLTILKDRNGQPIDDLVTPAWSISFPGSGREDDRVEYVVNSTWIQEFFDDPDTDEDEELSE